jgi:hypothetical protein
MEYDLNDPRSRDLADRIAFVKNVMVGDADRLSHAFEKFAKDNAGDPVLHSGCRRLATALRDFCTHMQQTFAAMP